MNVHTLKNQLIRDLKSSWQKTALLTMLFLVGLIFWIPQLLRAVTGKSGMAKGGAVAVAAPAPRPAELPTTTVAAAPDATKDEFTWERGQKLLQTDPLVRSVEVAALRGDPFRIDRDQFPPPLLFEEEPVKAQSAPSPQPPITDARLTEKLILKSTIVGLKRRAAFINNKLYYEGREIQVEGQTFLLSAVYPRKVLLTQGSTVFELSIPSSFTSEAIGVQSHPDGTTIP